MTRSNNDMISPNVSPRRRNVIAAILAMGALGFLHMNFDPVPAGSDVEQVAVDIEKLSGPQAFASVLAASDVSGSKSDTVIQSNRTGVTDSRAALEANLAMLEKGYAKLLAVSGYTATFFKRERIGTAIDKGQVISLKLRHRPFSVYMKWLVGDKGRELLYVDGANDGRMLVRVGGVRGRLLPTIKIDPHSSLALRESRHSVTDIGLLNLLKRMIENRRGELAGPKLEITCRVVEGQKFDGRACCCFILDYAHPGVCDPYRRTVQFVDEELSIPVCIRNFGWPDNDETLSDAELDKSTLLEHYSYSNIQMNSRLAEIDFDRSNRNYRFRR